MNTNEFAGKALDFKHKGYNCCQSVLMACADFTKLSEQQLVALGSGFGAGMGNMEGTCGALVGAVMAAGFATRGEGTMRIARSISDNFKQKCGATICKDLKGMETGMPLCSCDDCVFNAAVAFCECLPQI